MRGAATATRIQNRTMTTPIVALLERSMSDISFRSRLPNEDRPYKGRSILDGSRGAAGCGVASGTDSEMSPILLARSNSLLVKPKTGIYVVHANVRHCLSCHRHEGQYQCSSHQEDIIVPHRCIKEKTAQPRIIEQHLDDDDAAN